MFLTYYVFICSQGSSKVCPKPVNRAGTALGVKLGLTPPTHPIRLLSTIGQFALIVADLHKADSRRGRVSPGFAKAEPQPRAA